MVYTDTSATDINGGHKPGQPMASLKQSKPTPYKHDVNLGGATDSRGSLVRAPFDLRGTTNSVCPNQINN
jgi:hypothetical protein